MHKMDKMYHYYPLKYSLSAKRIVRFSHFWKAFTFAILISAKIESAMSVF